MSRNITIFTVCCFLCFVSMIMYYAELTEIPASLYTHSNNTGIPRPLRKFTPTPISVDISKVCEKICDREMQSCFDPVLSVFVYDGISPEKMSFEQIFTNFSPKIDSEEEEKKWKHNRPLCPVNELDESLQTMTKQASCAIIGNSGILLGSECGEDINSHDFVLRANLAVLEGYTRDVGTKTNMMMVNYSTLQRIVRVLGGKSAAKGDMLRYFKSLNGAIIWYPKGSGGSSGKRLRRTASLLLEEKIPAKFAFNFQSAIGVTKGKWKTPKLASSGLIAFTVAQTFCKNITLYGFYPYQHDETGAPVLYHYYEPKLTDFHTSAHNFDKEHRLLRSLHDKHLIKLVIGSCKNINESTSLRPIPDEKHIQPKPAMVKMCKKICDRKNQTCFDLPLAILVYDAAADPRRMSFQQSFSSIGITSGENTDRFNMEAGNDANNRVNFCPITDVDPSLETMSVHQRCAIVENDGVLLNSKCGKEIDSHSFILRSNMADAEISAEDVGNKTDIMMLNLQIVEFIYDTFFALRRTSRRKQNYEKLIQSFQKLNDSILWYPESTANGTARKLQKIAGSILKQKINVRFGFSFTDIGAVTRRKWMLKGKPSSRLILLTVAETFCDKITLYGFHSGETLITKAENNVNEFNNESQIFESLQQKGVLTQALVPCENM